MTRSLILPLSISLAACFCAGTALAGVSYEWEYTAQLEVLADDVEQPATNGPSGTTIVAPDSNFSFSLPAGAIVAGGTAVNTGKGGDVASIRFDGSSGAGSLDGTGGVLPVSGSMWVTFLGEFADMGTWQLPLSPLGGGSAETIATTTPSGERWEFRVEGSRWQVGQVSFSARRGNVNGTMLTATETASVGTLTGEDGREITPSNLRITGPLRLIGPMKITAMRTTGGVGRFLEVPVAGRLVIPEPGLLALQLAAAGVIAAAGWSRRKRR